MKRNVLLGLTLIAATVAVNAQALEVSGSVTSSAVVTRFDNKLSAGATATTKPVYLMDVKLTDKEKQKINNYNPKKTQSLSAQTATGLPSSVQLGMNNVPVLDQGRHGTCVTFANTAALDAVLGIGDQISQLCSLELGSYLANNGYLMSGWDGTWGRYVLNQFFQFGYINMDDQRSKSCSGVREYPVNDARSKGKPISLESFKTMSININNQLTWSPIVNLEQRFDEQTIDPYDGKAALDSVKKALYSEVATKVRSRVTFGTILPVDYCHAGACGTFHKTNDTWALTSAMERDRSPNLAGHEMVITGYDDNAVVTDNEGKQHTGLLTLRNSWGNDVGDGGNYYMSYDFFMKYVLEAQQIKIATDNQS